MTIEKDNLLQAIIDGIEEKKGENIKTLNLQKMQGSICDYFVICQAESNIQVIAIADSIIETVRKKTGEKVAYSEGYENAQWILLDYFNIIVHIFQSNYREFYNLEGLWADAEVQIN